MKTTKRLLALVMSLALMLALTPVPSKAYSIGQDALLYGSGTEDDPYRIMSVDDLLAFAELANGNRPDAHAALMCDLVLPNGLAWEPIGSYPAPYTGVFDGRGHTICGLRCGSGEYSAMFNYIGKEKPEENEANGVVRNLGLVDVNMDSGAVGSASFVGFNYGVVENCYSTGTVGYSNVPAGIAVVNDGTVANCWTNCTFYGTAVIGGVVGVNTGSVTGCWSVSTIPAALSDKRIGGVVGQNFGTVSGCYYSRDAADVDPVGENMNEDPDAVTEVLGLSASQMQGSGALSVMSGLDADAWVTGDGYPALKIFEHAVPAGSGTSDDPYQIGSYEELRTYSELVNFGIGEHFCAVLTADIDASASAQLETEWLPIGLNIDYLDVFDGDGHVIRGLTNLMTLDEAGVFSDLDWGGTIRNLGVEGGSFRGVWHNGKPGYAGGIVGQNSGTVTNCYSTATVYADANAGGVVGYNSGTVTNCYSIGAVSAGDIGEYPGAGGVAGYNSGTVACCYSAGAVSGYQYAGGVVGALTGGVVASSYYDSELFGINSAIDCLEGDYTVSSVSGLTTAQMTGRNALSNMSGFSTDDWAATPNYPRLKAFPPQGIGNLVRDEDGNLLISSTADWEELAGLIAADPDVAADETFLQTADFTVTTMLGTSDKPFKGAYDGGGHTLTLSLSAEDRNTSVAPFRNISGATIRRLRVEGQVVGGNHSSGLIVGLSGGGNTVTDVAVAAEICGCDGNITHVGGFLGHGGGGAYSLVLEGCVFSGSITGAVTNAGTFVGWSDSISVTLKNCLDSSETRWYFGMGKAGAGSITVENCYYTYPNKQDGTWGNGAWQWPADMHGAPAYAVTPGTNVSLALSGADSSYETTRLAAADGQPGLGAGDAVYAGEGESVGLTLGYTGSDRLDGFNASAGTLSGSGDSYTLAMPAQDVGITAMTTVVTPVSYVNAAGEDMGTELCTVVDAETTAWSSGWYAVTQDVTVPARIEISGDVNLILCDGATLTASQGIRLPENNSLTVWAQSDALADDSSAGSLIATSTNPNQAGIGGNARQSAGSLTINGGHITAACSASGNVHAAAAGIGGGNMGFGGTVTIRGGAISATCSASGDGCTAAGAGIGGGEYGECGTVTVYGGSLYAACSASGDGCYATGAGIGGGAYYSGGTFTIYDGCVTASCSVSGVNSAAYGAGIGGGSWGSGGTVTIRGGSVTANCDASGDNFVALGAGIGGGQYGAGGSVVISGGSVTASAGSGANSGEAIGHGNGSQKSGELKLPGMKVTAPADVTALGRETACHGKSVRLEVCDAHQDGNGDGKCDLCDALCGAIPYIDPTGGNAWPNPCENYTILTNQTEFSSGWYVAAPGTVTIGTRITVSGDVHLILMDGATLIAPSGVEVDGANSLTIWGQSAGTGTLYAGTNGTKNGSGNYTVTCGDYRAGIGGDGYNTVYGGPLGAEHAGTIAINGGTVTAAGGNVCAAIGGGGSGTGGRITINGGTVTAQGGDIGGTGIGGGKFGAGGDITITGGTVIATGGGTGAGIGSGAAADSGGNITISGGTVVATGGDMAAGIGGGWRSGGADVTITGGTVIAVAGNANAQAIGHGESSTVEGSLSIPGMRVYADQGDMDADPDVPVGILDRETACRGGWAGLKVCEHDYHGGPVCWLCGDCQSVDFFIPDTVENPPASPCDDYIPYDGQLNLEDGNWYVVFRDTTVSERIAVNGTVNLILCDGVTLTAAQGVRVAEGNALTVWAQSDATVENSTAGCLFATGTGKYQAGIGGDINQSAGSITINGGTVTVRGGNLAAGIGGGADGSGGTITITASTVNATGGTGGAGIGGGNHNVSGGDGGTIKITDSAVTANGGHGATGIGGGESGSGGTIAITGGTVVATGGPTGAGIGGGYKGNGGTITITDCFVTATGGTDAAGIGGGEYGSGGTITITGGTVTANGGKDGAGIGGGYGSNQGGDGGTITITDCLVTATGGVEAAGIGGGEYGSGGTITITGGTVTAISGTDGAGIGGGYQGNGGTITIIDSTVNATGGKYGAGIGGGYQGNGGTIAISGGTVTATAGSDAQAVGHGYSASDSGKLIIPGMKVTDPTGVTALGREAACHGGSVTLVKCEAHTDENNDNLCDLCGAVLGSITYLDPTGGNAYPNPCTEYTAVTGMTASLSDGWYVAAPGTTVLDTRITVTGDVHLILMGGATLTAKAGITVSPGNTLTVWGQTGQTGVLLAGTDGTTAANGAYIPALAAGGSMIGAGIGGVNDGDAGTVVINGGAVTAVGYFAAGVGPGYFHPRAAGTVTVNGGALTAQGGTDAAGVGGDHITISGGTVTATGGTYGAGIGGCLEADGGEIAITGGTVTAIAGVNAQAIGHGYESDDSGSLTLGGMRVYGSATAAAPVASGDRESTCRGEYAKLELCADHLEVVNGLCKWCGASVAAVSYQDPTDTSTPYKSRDTYTVYTGQQTLENGVWYVVKTSQTVPGRVTVRGAVNLILCDNVTLTVPKGVNVGENASFTVWAYTTLSNRGALTVNGVDGGNAAIGGNHDGPCGSITINGGTITAIASDGGAGIGAGMESACGEIAINAGYVTATGGEGAAGIGGGNYGVDGGRITITGGWITAKGGNGTYGLCGAGIGGGDSSPGCQVLISGGTVKATGGVSGVYAGAGIGGGSEGGGGDVTITGGTVTAIAGNENAQAIGRGDNGGSEGKLTFGYVRVTDPADTLADGRETACHGARVVLNPCGAHKVVNGACVFCRQQFSAVSYLDPTDENEPEKSCSQYTLLTDGSLKRFDTGWYVVPAGASVNYDTYARIEVTGDVNLILCDGAKLDVGKGIHLTGSNSLTIWAQSTGDQMGALEIEHILNDYQAGIGGNDGEDGGTFTVNGGALDIDGWEQGAAIGGGRSGAGGTITINGGTVTAEGEWYGAGIGGGKFGAGGTVLITGGTVTAEGGYESPGIGGGAYGDGGTVTITGGTVTAKGSSSGAGIGGGETGAGGTVIITGGTVTATGGSQAAGIGGGEKGAGGTVTISGGTVTAIGDWYGPGIGGGNYGSGGTVTISGGTVTATGGYLCAGIGSGGYSSNTGIPLTAGTVTISGGTVIATGGGDGAGIGGGNCVAGGTVLITGGTVTATGGPNNSNTCSGAGIGGGSWGSGGTVTISGGTVTAIAGNVNAQAIGRGDAYNYTGETLTEGSLSIEAMKVFADDAATEPVASADRADTCRTAWARLALCDSHSYTVYTYTLQTHTARCAWCGVEGATGAHSFPDGSAACEVCHAPRPALVLEAIPNQTYTGAALTPAVTVRNGSGTELTEGTDYTLSYATDDAAQQTVTAPVNAGGYLVTVTGTGDYAAALTVTGQFTVDRKEVTVTAGSGTKIYDGTPLTNEGYTNTELAAGDVMERVTITGSRTDAGESANVPSAAVIQNANGGDATGNYMITYVNGTLTVTALAGVVVTVIGHNDIAAYDTSLHTVTGYDLEFSDPLYTEACIRFTGAAVASRTDVGTTYMGLDADQFENLSANFTGVVFRITDGYQTIVGPGEVVVTITGRHNTTTYDGQEHTVTGYDVQISNPLYEESDIVFTGASASAGRTDAGTTWMGLAADQFMNNNGNFSNVRFVVSDGYQTIETRPVTVTAKDQTVEQGRAITLGPEQATLTGAVAGHLLTAVTLTDSGTDAITDSGTITPSGAAISDTQGVDVTGNYAISYVDGVLTVAEHAWGNWIVTTAPTCTKAGEETRYCANCDAFETRPKDALGHDLIHHEGQEPSCTEIGWAAYDTCSRCDYTTYEEIAALGHDLIPHEGQEPNCTEAGWAAYDTCSRCDYTTYEEIPALGHDLIHHDAQPASCTETGWNAYDTCSRCDYTTYVEIPALGHDLIHHEGQEPSCTEIGWAAYDTCSRCDYTTYEEIAALGHDLVHHAAQDPTCTEIGWAAYDTCSRCDYTTYEEIAALGHDLVHHAAQDPTCTEIGWEAYDTCSRCDYTTYVEIPALGHDLIHHDAKPATCTEIGWAAYDTCSRCDYTTYVEIPALGHDPIHHEGQEPSCTEIGWAAYDTCSRCDYTTYEEIAALGHDLIHHDAKPATCTEIGWETYDTCSRCDYTTYEEIAALGHDLVHHAAQDPTCTEIGWEAYDTCSRCDYTTYEETPALGHDLVHHAAQDPTCTEIGWEAYDTCSRCDYTTYVEIPALGHDLVHHAAQDPTCTEIGWAAYDTCSCCDYTTYVEIPALGHDLIHHEAQEPTCTEIGWGAYDTCSRCDYSTYVELEALGHDLIHHDAKLATCTEIGWEAYDTCSRCDYTTYEEIAALGHDLIHHDAKPATCTEIGWAAYDTCSRCDYTTYEEIAALGHDLIPHEGQDPSCTEAGWAAYDTCSRCDYTTYKEIAALGHDLVHHDAKPATCTEIGWEAYDTCSRCDYTTYEETPALGHDLVHHDAQDPTCTEIGWAAYDTCSRCDYTTYEEIAALGHDLIHHEAQEPTCTENGWGTYDTCSRCDYTTYVEIPALGHDLIHHEAQEPTCTENGRAAYDTCSRCDYTTYVEIPALGHDLIHHDAKPATCTEIGWEAYDTCSRCDYTTYEEIAALGHDLIHHEGQEPNCTEAGWAAYDTCSRCDYTTYEEIAALGHDLIPHEGQEPNCTEAGWAAYDTCSRCDYTTYEEIPALGHDLVHHAAQDPTCTEIGWGAYDTCSRCDYTTYEELAALGHDLVHHDAKPATCTEIGWEAYDTCSRCDYTTYVEIPALGHDLIHHDAKPATCMEIGWAAYDTCSRCDYTTYVEIPALGHTWGDPTYVWADDNSTVTATRVCGRDESHVESEAAVTTGKVTKPAAYGVRGETTYTAVFTNEAFATQTTTVDDIPSLTPTVYPAPTEKPASFPFVDVSKDAWYYDSIYDIWMQTLMIGIDETHFGPDLDTERAMVVTILYRLAGEPETGECAFDDISPKDYFAKAVAWGQETGIAKGFNDGKFHPHEPVTREQLAAFLLRYAAYQGKEIETTGLLDRFTDADQISDYALDSMRWAVQSGLILGTDQNRLKPKAPATRAELAAILDRFTVFLG